MALKYRKTKRGGYMWSKKKKTSAGKSKRNKSKGKKRHSGGTYNRKKTKVKNK